MAIRSLQIADHMTYVTYPLINENRLLLKIFDEIYNSIRLGIRIIVGEIDDGIDDGNVDSDIRMFNIFFNDYAKDYGLSNFQIKSLIEIIELNEKHKNSAMEFSRAERVVILSDNLTTQMLDIRTVKEYLLLAKEFFVIVNRKIGQTKV